MLVKYKIKNSSEWNNVYCIMVLLVWDKKSDTPVELTITQKLCFTYK